MIKNDETTPTQIAAAWMVEQAAKKAKFETDEACKKAIAVAVELDLNARAAEMIALYARLVFLETQTRDLAEAVMEITIQLRTLAPALEAVQTSMNRGETTAKPDPPS